MPNTHNTYGIRKHERWKEGRRKETPTINIRFGHVPVLATRYLVHVYVRFEDRVGYQYSRVTYFIPGASDNRRVS